MTQVGGTQFVTFPRKGSNSGNSISGFITGETYFAGAVKTGINPGNAVPPLSHNINRKIKR